MLIDIQLSGGAFLAQPLYIPDPCAVPRAGEYIETPEHLFESVERMPQLLVAQVGYRMHPVHGWQAVVRAVPREEAPARRAEMLEELGWLGTAALP